MAAGQNGMDGAYVRPRVDRGTGQGLDFVIIHPGIFCNGNTSDLDFCNTHECPVNGNWGSWSSWNICSATCDGGIQDRTRKCDSPHPINGGLYCNGTMIGSRPCNNINCEIDGQWGTWQEWEACNTTCGNGFQQRIRKCDSPSPYFGGSECIGLDFDTKTCYQDVCPVDGNWGGWSPWNICSATCDGGIQDRTRKCESPQPINGGLYCNGTMIDSRACNNINCEIDGQWGTWQAWEACNTTCGNGTQQRIRKCDSPSPYFNGSACMGLDFDSQICYQDKCPDVQLQANEDTPNCISPVILGSAAVVFIVITTAITCISFFVFRRFRPGQVVTLKVLLN